MPNENGGPHDEGLGADQHAPMPETGGPWRDRWRYIFLILQTCQILVSRVEESRRRSLTLAGISAAPYNRIMISTSSSPQVSLEIFSGTDDDKVAKILKKKDLVSLREYGGVQRIAEALGTDLEKGIPGEEQDLLLRHMANKLSKRKPTPTFFQCLAKACNNYTIFLLLLCAVLSVSFGINKEGLETGWYEGFLILLAVIIIVVFHSMRDFWYGNQRKLSDKHDILEKMEMVVEVIRGGYQHKISISEIVVGDIVCLKRGYQAPADGLYVSGEALELEDHLESIVDDRNPFIFFGAKVINGNGRMLVTSVGMNTEWGEMMSRVIDAPNKTPLEAQLDKVNNCSQIIGLLISILLVVVLFLRLKFGEEDDTPGIPDVRGKPPLIKDVMDAFRRIVTKQIGKISVMTSSLTMTVAGIIEGYPFVLTVAFKYWNKKTMSGKGLSRELLACVTMGSVTTICTDETGGLTLNPVEVEVCRIGEEDIYDDSIIDLDVLEILCDGVNSPVPSEHDACGSENDAVLSWTELKVGRKMMNIWNGSCTIIEAKELNSCEEGSQVLMKKKRGNDTITCFHCKGPATTILAMCSLYYDSKGKIKDMDENKRMDFEQAIEQMQSKHLKTIAFAYKKIEGQTVEPNNLILIALLGLRDMCWRDTAEALEACRNAGVNIKLVSADNVSVLEATAQKFGIDVTNALVLEGRDFRDCSHQERMDKAEQILIMGNSLPSDRLLLIECLRQKGHLVAVVGGKTHETPSLKAADVGVTLATWSTKIARDTSDIDVLDRNFSFLVTIMKHGRCAYENVQKYTQLELTMTITGLLISFITSSSYGDSAITSIQVYWANLIVAIPGGIALLREPPAKKLMRNQPVGHSGTLITKAMWRNMTAQASYQVGILVSIQCYGAAILGTNPEVVKSLVFNSYVLCQVFNLYNCRKLEKKNVFKGIHRNRWFCVSVGGILVLQAVFIEIEHIVGGSARLNCRQWGICFLIGMASWVIDWATKWASGFITDCWFLKVSRLPYLQKRFTQIAPGETSPLPKSVSGLERKENH